MISRQEVPKLDKFGLHLNLVILDQIFEPR
jgi:hypothetical protein